MEHELPMREYERSEREEPNVTKSNKEIVEPNLPNPYTLNADPYLAKLRMDNEELKWV